MATSTAATGKLFVVSTSHLDWNWIATFEQYYNIGNPTGPTYAVRDILDTAIFLMLKTKVLASGVATASDLYQYNLAELAWLQRYLQDKPSLIPTLASLEGQFFLLGGGVTSPDNLMCNGEAFIRNYLVGRTYVKNIGLGGLLSDVCWIPDDFGQDPQLPVVLVAMGMKGVSFWRVPGNQPIPPVYLPVEPPTPPPNPSLSEQLMSSGVTFLWQAADNSTILTQQMSSGYGVIWDQSGPSATAAASLSEFVSASGVLQPGNLFVAPCGADFSMPSLNLLKAVHSYNQTPVKGICAELHTFEDFIDAMNQYERDNPGTLKTWKSFDASNYWTGCFAGRVELKIRQQRTVNHLLAAETLSTLLRGQANLSGAVLDAIDRAIDAAWENLVPSTHHDYVVGTAPDQTYWMEQEPLSALALAQSSAALAEAMSRLGQAVKPAPQTDEIPYVAFNPSGFARQVGTVVEIPAQPNLERVTSFRLPGGPSGAVQKLQNGNILLPYPKLGSTGYGCIYLSKTPLAHASALTPPAEAPATSFTFDNGIVQITVAQASGWAITSIKDLQNGGAERLTGAVNQIAVYYELCNGNGANCGGSSAAGNLYQMGNELGAAYAEKGGFYTDDTGVFAGGDGSMAESGPYRQHFIGKIHNETNNLTFTVEYLLEAGEPLVRMRVTGQAASTATSIVTSWTLQDQSGKPPSGMSYGTPNHWNGPGYVPYWYGPTFRATHDFVLLLEQGNETGNPLAAIYHEGIRAWAFDGQTLMGVLFRNAPGLLRGAAGTDTSCTCNTTPSDFPESAARSPVSHFRNRSRFSCGNPLPPS